MSFNWKQYYLLAKELGELGPGDSNKEARKRAGISRSYYSAFGVSRNYLIEKERTSIPNNAEAHRITLETFERSSDRARRKVGEKLRELRGNRNKADYENRFTGLDSAYEYCLKKAKEVLDRIEKLGG